MKAHNQRKMVPLTPNASKTPNSRTACLCDIVFLLKYPPNFDMKSTKSDEITSINIDHVFVQVKLLTFIHIKSE